MIITAARAIFDSVVEELASVILVDVVSCILPRLSSIIIDVISCDLLFELSDAGAPVHDKLICEPGGSIVLGRTYGYAYDIKQS